MRRIMFVCQSLGNGGAERVVSILSDAMTGQNDEIYILAMSDINRAYKVNERVHVLIPSKPIKAGILGKMQRIRLIRKVVKENNIDVIIAFSHYNAMFSVIASTGLNVKVIGSERNDPAQLDHRKITKEIRLLLYKKLDCLVCQTDMAKAYFPEKIQEKAVVIMNPISDNLPEPYVGEREKRIVSFSRFEKQKNIPMLIDAFDMFHRDFPEYVLELYGDGSEKESIKKYVVEKELTDNVIIHSFKKDIHKRIEKAAMFALASDYEGLSNSMLEAMALGIPTVVTDCPCGGARMVINDGENGYLVPVRDTNTMYLTMKYVIEHEVEAQRVAQKATDIRRILEKSEIAKQWVNTINRI